MTEGVLGFVWGTDPATAKADMLEIKDLFYDREMGGGGGARALVIPQGIFGEGEPDQVWELLEQRPGLRTDGHNVCLYHHPANRQSPMDVDIHELSSLTE